jgi:hypothetical protein
MGFAKKLRTVLDTQLREKLTGATQEEASHTRASKRKLLTHPEDNGMNDEGLPSCFLWCDIALLVNFVPPEGPEGYPFFCASMANLEASGCLSECRKDPEVSIMRAMCSSVATDTNSDTDLPACLLGCDPQLLENLVTTEGSEGLAALCPSVLRLESSGCHSECSDDPEVSIILAMCSSVNGAHIFCPFVYFALGEERMRVELLLRRGCVDVAGGTVPTPPENSGPASSWFEAMLDLFQGSSSNESDREVELDSDSCTGVLHLADMTSPYSGSTSNASNFFLPSCTFSSSVSRAGDVAMMYSLAPGSTFRLRQTTNNYDSVHELRYGGDCPGEYTAQCFDDPDLDMVQWTNGGAEAENVYYIQTGYSASEGAFTVEWEVTVSGEASQWPVPNDPNELDSDSCTGVLHLVNMTSPYSGSTRNALNFFVPSCGSGANAQAGDVAMMYTLAPGSTFRLRQTTNDYDSVHELRYGGDCPGEYSVQCFDDPDLDMVQWTNGGDAAENVYYIQTGFYASEGAFTVEWEVTVSGEASQWPVPNDPTELDSDSCTGVLHLANMTSPYSGSTSNALNFFVPSCGSGANAQAGDVAMMYTLAPGSTFRLRQTTNNYDSVHELRYGGDCPGEFTAQCFDDPDLDMVQWTNGGAEAENVYYIQTGYSASEGAFTVEWEVTVSGEASQWPDPMPPSLFPPWTETTPELDSDSCTGVLHLADMTSPYSGSTSNASNFFLPSCTSSGQAGDVAMMYTLAPGSTFRLRQTTNNYDSVHELRYGGDCPGEYSVRCFDDPDLDMVQWTNGGAEAENVYYIQTGFYASEGAFTVEWEVTVSGETSQWPPSQWPAYPSSPPFYYYTDSDARDSELSSYPDPCGPGGEHAECEWVAGWHGVTVPCRVARSNSKR